MIAGGPRGSTIAARIGRDTPRSSLLRITDKAVDPIVAKRFVAARLLSGLNQEEAAERLGFKNSSGLSKIEGQKASAQRYVVIRASVVYAVSADYLLGLSDFPERDPRTVEKLAILRHLRKVITDNAAAHMSQLLALSADMPALRAHLNTLIAGIGDAFQTMVRSTAVNDPCPEAVQASLDKLVEAGEAAQRFLKRQASIAAGETGGSGRAVVPADELFDEDAEEYPLLTLIEGRSEAELSRDVARAGEVERAQ